MYNETNETGGPGDRGFQCHCPSRNGVVRIMIQDQAVTEEDHLYRV